MVILRRASRSSRVGIEDFTLVIGDLPATMVKDSHLSAWVHATCGIEPKSVCICFKIKRHMPKIQQVLATLEASPKSGGNYINLDYCKLLNVGQLECSGKALVVFDSIKSLNVAKARFTKAKIKTDYCDFNSESVIWENFESRANIIKQCACTILVCFGILLGWSVFFFIPYAAYRLHTQLEDVFENLWLNIFVSVAGACMGSALQLAVDSIDFTSKRHRRRLLLWCNFFVQVLVIGLNVLLSHATNYGGRTKLMWLLGQHVHQSSTFQVGEEISMSLSFCGYMVNTLLAVPLAIALLVHALGPWLGKALVLVGDFDQETINKLAKYPEFETGGRYCDSLAYLTCSLLVHVFLVPQYDRIIVCASLVLHVLICILRDRLVLCYRSASRISDDQGADFTPLAIWGVPCAILAAYPEYWNQRTGTLQMLPIVYALLKHVILYYTALALSCYRVKPNAINRENFDWRLYNPIYKASNMLAI
ncbi:uncharacterized protein BdWA1_003791 [Babesia duncani]|nr:hypothetical protein BdWA1_003791 [Babesia duncani]